MQLVYWGLAFNLVGCFMLKGMDENQFGDLSHFPLEVLEMIAERIPDKDTKLYEVEYLLAPLSKTCKIGRHLAQRAFFAKEIEDTIDPLGFSIRNGVTPLFNQLIYFNYADIKKRPDYIQSLFFAAVIFEKPKIIDALVGLGAQVDALRENGETALFTLLRKGYFKSFESLLAHKANINLGAEIDGFYKTPLQLAQMKREIPDDPMRSVDAPCQEKYEHAIQRLKALGAQG